MMTVKIIGAGLAGCEAAWQLAQRGIDVELFEMKPAKMTAAHTSHEFSELVCSNSLRSNDLTNAVGLLKEEMRRLDSLIMKCADETRIPAGGALAVDRMHFSRLVTRRISEHPRISIFSEEITKVPDGRVIIATGPLTTDTLAGEIVSLLPSEDLLSYYDAAAPIVMSDSVDMNNAFFGSRYDKGENDSSESGDYINCPMEKDDYLDFYRELISAEEAQVHGFEDKRVFEGCIPIEVMARRGEDTMRFGPLKPVGLFNPKTGSKPYAVVQLRKENAEGTLYNLVGFQTHLKFPEQKRVFSMIPALKNAEFVRYGVMHRNTYINSPQSLDRYYRLKSNPNISFAGQISGVEGYVESAASGMLVGIETANELHNQPMIDFPKDTAIGALALYVSGGAVSDFQPMNINFGLIEPLDIRIKGKRNKNLVISKRSLEIIDRLIANNPTDS